MSKHLSVIIPAYNEENRIKETLGEVYNYLTRQSYSWEVIVVSDGSRDRTVEVVSEFISNKPEVSLIANTKNHGKGYVVRQGMFQTDGSYRIFTDADNSTSIEPITISYPSSVKYGQNFSICSIVVELSASVKSRKSPWVCRIPCRTTYPLP